MLERQALYGAVSQLINADVLMDKPYLFLEQDLSSNRALIFMPWGTIFETVTRRAWDVYFVSQQS